jgi:hypothetical protein
MATRGKGGSREQKDERDVIRLDPEPTESEFTPENVKKWAREYAEDPDRDELPVDLPP